MLSFTPRNIPHFTKANALAAYLMAMATATKTGEIQKTVIHSQPELGFSPLSAKRIISNPMISARMITSISHVIIQLMTLKSRIMAFRKQMTLLALFWTSGLNKGSANMLILYCSQENTVK